MEKKINQPDEKVITKLIVRKLQESDLFQNHRNRKTRMIVEMKMREMYLTGYNNAKS